mmetsp:Transcript_4715/g.7899  ORF Transcript_4715/g.7899 Transcript_4715/m.7899 type:complete len:204 (+) Transcript_4715:235-846(+)
MVASAEAATGSSTPTLEPRSTARPMSFSACCSGKFAAWSPDTIFGPLSLNMPFDMTPRSSTWRSWVGSSPDASARLMPSPNAAIIEPMTMFTTSFIRVPFPTSPKKNLALPIASRSDATEAYSASSPAARKMSWPAAAGPFEPDTGASRKRPPRSATCAESRCMSVSQRVAQSMMHVLAETPARTPSSISYTAFTADGVDSMQ